MLALKVAPAGRLLAEYSRGSPSGSDAATVKLSSVPSITVLLPIGEITGARFAGEGVGDGVGVGETDEVGVGVGVGEGEGDGDGKGEGDGVGIDVVVGTLVCSRETYSFSQFGKDV